MPNDNDGLNVRWAIEEEHLKALRALNLNAKMPRKKAQIGNPAAVVVEGDLMPQMMWLDDALNPIMPEAPPPAKKRVREPVPEVSIMSPVEYEKSTRLPRFKMKYENAEEARLRLANTIITINDRPVYVNDVGNSAVGPYLIVHTSDHKADKVYLSDGLGLNLRSFDPGYITLKNEAWYLHRIPARIYKQGISEQNSRIKLAGKTTIRSPLEYDLFEVLKALEDRPVIRYSPDMEKFILARGQSQRLCDALSIYYGGASKIKVEYKGRLLGTLSNNKIVLDNPEDAYCSWICQAISNVGLSVA